MEGQRRGRRTAGETSRAVPAAKRIFCVLILLCAVVVSIRTTWIVSGTLFDSDTSSELILGEKLAREGGILSEGWAYSTEIQVIDCQLVYALLFHLTSDWFLVRFWGAVLMQLMMLGAFGFLARQARIPFNRFCLAAAAMLLPFSVPYGRIVLYHCYYAFHLILANLTVGLYFAVIRRWGRENGWKKPAVWICGVILALISFGAGLEGVRQMMVCTVPLLATALLSAMVSERGRNQESLNRLRENAPALLWALVPIAFSGLGYLVNLNSFAGRYSFRDYSGQYVTLRGVGELDNIARGFLATLGFHDQNTLFELYGLLGICGVLIWLVSVLLGFHTLRNSRDAYARFLSIFMLMTHLVMVCVFMLLSLEDYRKDLYFLPVTFWILPALAKADLRRDSGMEETGEKPKGLKGWFTAGDAKISVHGVIATLVLLLFIANGIYYTGFFRDPGSYRHVDYAGLDYTDTDNVKGMQPVAEYLQENGYSMVYAPYWQAAVVTELTNGEVRSLPVEVGRRKHPIMYYNWLSDLSLRDPEKLPEGKAAILANFDLAAELGEGNQYGAEERETVGGYTIYELPDPAALAKDLAK